MSNIACLKIANFHPKNMLKVERFEVGTLAIFNTEYVNRKRSVKRWIKYTEIKGKSESGRELMGIKWQRRVRSVDDG